MDKAINSLLGILEGITIDSLLNEQETGYLATWLIEHQEYANKHPFNELLPVIARSIQDNILSTDEHEEIVWLCEKFKSSEYYSENVADLQRLQAILVGIAADGTITKDELDGLSDWLADHDHLRKCYPYDEIDSLIVHALADQKIDKREHEDLLMFFSEFSETKPKTIEMPNSYSPMVTGICAVAPTIEFLNSTFCFTGESTRFLRRELSDHVVARGGTVAKGVSRKINYLVVGAAGNPCWKYACYGLKIERAIDLRKEGHQIVIVHEIDFHDAMA
jgi:NAD-dependent DNA ligase